MGSSEYGLRRVVAFTPEEDEANRAYETSPAVRSDLTYAIRNERDPNKRAILESSYQQDFGRPSGVSGDLPMAPAAIKARSTIDPLAGAFAEMDRVAGKVGGSSAPAGNPQASQETGNDLLNSAFAAMDAANKPAKQKRGIGEIATDTAIGFAKGSGSLVKGIGWLAGSDALTQAGSDAEGYWGEKQSSELQRQLAEVGKAEGVFGTVEALWKNPAAIGDYIATSVPQMIPGMGVGSVGARGIVALAGNSARNAALKAGATEATAMQAGRIAAEKAAEKAAERFAIGSNMIGEGAVSGGTTGAEVEQFMLDHGASPDQARSEANKAALMAGSWTTAGAGIGAGMETKAMLGHLKDTGLKGFAKNVGKEALEEAIQNPGEDYAAYQAKVKLDPTQKFDPGKSATLGAVTGGIMGSGFHAAGRIGEQNTDKPANEKSGFHESKPDQETALPQDAPQNSPPSAFSAEGEHIPYSQTAERTPYGQFNQENYGYSLPAAGAAFAVPATSRTVDGEVIGPLALPPGQKLLPQPPIDGESHRVYDLPRQMLENADQPQPSVRQLATARGLLNHNPSATPESIARLMRIDDGMAQRLYQMWQQSQGEKDGAESSNGRNAEVAAQGAQGGRGLLPGSADVLASASAGDTGRASDSSGVAVSSMRPFGPAVDGGVGSVAQVTPLDAVAHNSATSILNVTPQLTDAQNPAAHADTTPNYRQMDPVSARRTADNLTRNGYPTKAVPHPTVAGMMTTIPADETAPAVSYGPAAEPVRNSEVQTVAPVQNASVAAQTRPRQSRITPMQDERLTDVFAGYQHRLETLMDEFGWAETGGRLLRDTDGNVSGRTPWVPHSEFWPGRPGNVSERDARKYVRDALEGKPLPAAGKRFITYMLDYQDAERKQQREVSNLEEEERDSFLSKLAEAREIADNDDIEAVLERLATKHGDDADGFNIDATTYLKGLIDEVQQRNASEDGQANSAATGEGEYPSGEATPARLPEEANRPSFELQPHTREEVANKDARAADESVAAREQADQSRESFTLTPQAVEHSAASTDQGGLFTPDGRATKAATSGQDTVAGKPVSEMSDSQLNQLANSSAGTVSLDAQNSAKTEVDRRATKQEATGTADEITGVIDRARTGDISATEFKAAFESLIAGKERIISELSKLTKDVLFKQFPGIGYRYKNGKKAEIVSAAYRSMLDDFVLGESISWSMGEKYEDVIRGYVEKTTDSDLAKFADKVKSASESRNQQRAAAASGMENPQTLEDYKRILASKAQEIGESATFAQARMAMTPEQRTRFDELVAEKSRGERKARADQQKTDVRVAAVSTEGQIVETKHTQTGEPLFVVKAAERVDRDVYNQWNATAKKLGGRYSSFRGAGAVPGFQFKTRENAEAFLAYIGGNAEQAKEAVKTKRDSFADDRSQSAVVRLNEMADALDERADERLGQERKVNTSRRASMAASAEASANSDKAMAQTMRNIAKAIQDGTAKFLDRVRQKTQIEMLAGFVRSAKSSELREKYPAYADQEKKKGEPATAETADYATFPNFTAYRSDLAKFGRQLLEHDGSKKLGARIIKVADDVTDAYLKFAKENLHKVSKFSKSNGDAASFSTKDAADEAINRSGYRGKAIVLQFKRGQNIIIMSPTEAKEQGIWQGDDDKRITLSNEMGAEIVAKNKELARYRLNMPYTFDGVAADKARLSAMGIETPAEFRAALREFIAMRETPKALDRVKELERSMVGRRNDGLDFFPTPVAVAQQMIDAADIKDGMTVLEPSAGMGHIAEQIREAGVEPDVVELSGDRRELLGAKGFNLVGHDFMDVTGEYDRIVMNPPFGDRRDAAHVQHAYELLKPGGRVVAIMGEGVFFGQDKKAQEFRDWLESVGGTSEKLDEGTFLDPSLPVNTGVNARMVVIDKPKSSGVESRAANSDIQFASNVIAELTDHDELFRYPVSKSSNLKTVFAEVYPGAKYFGEHTREDERDETSADHRFVFENHLGKRFYVYTTDAGKVWIDVSRLATFDGGNAIYAAVSNWAYNTRKKFQGDPAGVSPDATIRRTTNMLSSALRFGTTQHLEASPEQIKGDPEAGVEPLDWGANDIENIRQLIHTFTTTLYNKHPKLNDYHYDFEKQGFFDKRGTHVTQDRFDSGAEKPDAGRARAGEASLRRGVFLKSLISSESGERPGILEQVLNRSRSIVDGGLKGLLSKTTPADAGVSVSGGSESVRAIQAIADKFKSQFKGAAALDIRAVSTFQDIPPRFRPSPFAEGVFHDDAGLVYLVTANLRDQYGKLNEGRAWQVLLHEAVGHFGLAQMMGDRFKGILKQVMQAARAKGKVDTDIYQPGHADYATVEAVRLRYPDASDSEISQEVLARIAETDPGRTLFGYVRAVVRQWLRDTARSMGFSVETSTAELNDLVAKASGYMRAGRNLDQVALDSGSANSNTTESGLESRVHVAGDSGRQYSAEQQQTFRNIGREVETLTVKERVAGYWKDIGKRLTQGIADQFAPLKDLDQKAYMLARMSKGADGALEAMMMHGRVFIRDGGIYDVDAKDGGVIDKLLRPLGNEIDDFMWWVAGNRADTLAGLGKENLMTPDDIRSLKALADGKLGFDYTLRDGKKTRNRAEAYAEANAILQDFNKSVMDIAEESGLIDGEARAIWERDFYVPFYRDMEGDKPNFPSVKSGLVRQKAFERLKGGTGKLNHDLLANTLLNWSHLLGAAAKNRAAKASLDSAVKVGAAVKLASSENSSVSYRENGNEVHFEVIDPFVLNAVTALEFSGSSNPAIQAMGAFKRWLTIGVTANPAFKIRNLIRDSISAIGQGDLSYNIAKNLKEGYKGTNKESQTYASMLAGGGIIRFGTMIEGNRADHVRRLTEKGIDPNTIIDDESKLKMVWNRYLSPLLDAYNELGDRSENINRAALYEQLIAKGMGHAEASLAARDLMDFSMGGTFTLVRFLTQTVPFANARLQGLYKLGRAAKEDPRRMGYVVGAVALASLALLAAYGDDDDWKKREDWDRDNYWWFKIGDTAFRIPKPFEIGAIGTLAERSAELLFDEEMDGHRFGTRLLKMAGDTFKLNPVPQMFKPALDLYSNTDSFTGRPIESMGMERLRTEDRFTGRTSEVAKLLGSAGVLSPVQIDHVIRGYFGWLGTAAVTTVDQISHLSDDTERPSMKLRDTFLAGNFVETLPSNSSRYVSQMYSQSKEIEEAYNSWRNYIKTGDTEAAKEVYESEKDKIAKYKIVANIKQAEARLTAQARLIESNRTMSGEAKRDALDKIAKQKDKLARSIVRSAGFK